MKYRRLGATQNLVSELGFGTWPACGRPIPQREFDALIDTAVDLGINFFDTADNYGAGAIEKMLGRALRRYRRQDLLVCTKGGAGGSGRVDLSRRHLTQALDDSLRRMKIEYVDFYLVHAPDPLTPLEETLSVLTEFVEQGKVRHGGWSNFGPELVHLSAALSRTMGFQRLACGQVLYNMLWRWPETGLIQACEAEGLGLIAYSPLSGGLLTGKYRRGAVPGDSRAARNARFRRYWLTAQNLRARAKLSELAAYKGVPLNTLAISWLLRTRGVSTTLSGATCIAQLKENARAVDTDLSSREVADIEAVLDDVRNADQSTGRHVLT